MSNNDGKELMIPGMDDLKQQYGYAMVTKGDADAMWSDMLAGMPSGTPPRIKLNGKQFMLVDSSGEETPYPLKKMVEGPDGNLYMQALFLAARPKIQKSWYLKAYSPGQEPEAPDCFSNDGERPDASIKVPQCDTCAECPKNAWGSGTDQNGMATDGKACRDVKTFAVFVPGFGIYSFRIPPASFKNWARLGKQLASMSINPMMVKYLIGFDAKVSYPALVFMFGGVIPEKSIAAVMEKARSPEVIDIINNKISGGASTAAKTDTPKAAPEKAEEVEDDLGLDEEKTEKKAPKKTTKKTAKKTPEPVVEAEVVEEDDDLGLGLGGSEAGGAETGGEDDIMSDDDALAAELGL